MMSRTQIPLKKHEEWCCEHLHFVKKEREEEGRNGEPEELEEGVERNEKSEGLDLAGCLGARCA